MSDYLWLHEPQHKRPPCPSPTPGVYPNSCPLSRWCHLSISLSVVPFSSFLQSFPALGSFPMSGLFTSGGQTIGTSVLTSVLPMNIHVWFPLELTGLISLLSKGCSGVFSSTTVQKHQFFGTPPSLWSNSHICTWLLEKLLLWLYRTLSSKSCLCFLLCYLGFLKIYSYFLLMIYKNILHTANNNVKLNP